MIYVLLLECQSYRVENRTLHQLQAGLTDQIVFTFVHVGLHLANLGKNKVRMTGHSEVLTAIDGIASYPGHLFGGKSGLVSTVCACAKNPMISWGIVYHRLYHRLRTVNLYRTALKHGRLKVGISVRGLCHCL